MIEAEVGKYFDNIFTSTKPSTENLEALLKYVRSTITPQFNADLGKSYTKDEIYNALCQMHVGKALGPDGMHVVF